MSRTRRLLHVLAVASLLALPPARAAVVTIVNVDGAGEGFNDPTPVSPVGGNTATTLGAQRLAALQHAASIWGAQLASGVAIQVESAFNPISDCSATSGVLAFAGPNLVFRDFPGAPFAGTWYVEALANKLAGADLEASSRDIGATFNANVGTSGCLAGASWYYGLDAGAAGNQIDLVTVALHEMAHGLGFLDLVDLSTGAKFLNFNDAYMLNLENHATGELYPTMSNGERVTASKAGANLHWVGPAVVAGGDDLTAGQHASGHVEIYAPNPQNPGSSVGHFSTSLSPNQLMEPFDTGPKHDVGLARDLLTDIGWGAFVSLCGNGSLDPGEACDDGNTAGGDCCTADCLAALCEPDEEMPGASALVKPASLFKFVAKGSFDLPELAASDPTSAGADLSIFDTGGSGGSAVFTLPAEGWFGLGSPAGSNGYKYLGSGTSGDACSLVLVKPTVVKAVCRGSDVTVTPPLGGDLGIVLRLGTASKRYCASYGGSVVSNQDGLFKAKNAPAAACATAP